MIKLEEEEEEVRGWKYSVLAQETENWRPSRKCQAT
jgi:hypothetical protein